MKITARRMSNPVRGNGKLIRGGVNLPGGALATPQRRRHHRRFFPLWSYWWPQAYAHPAYPAYPVDPWPTYGYPPYADPDVAPPWSQPGDCPDPLLNGCTRLNITPRWATACFMPRFRYLRQQYGSNASALASAIAREEAPDCPFPPQSGAAAEYERRIQLAVAVLLNREGIPTRYPPDPTTPRPPEADTITQPWMRALLTGWL